MYRLNKWNFGKFKSYEIFSSLSKNSFCLVPERGACLSQLILKGKDIYDGYENIEDLEKLSWGRGVLLAPFPNRLKDGKYTWDGKEYQFPTNNSSTQNAIHGFIRHQELEIVNSDLRETSASITCQYEYNGSFDYYPFPFHFQVIYIIDDIKGFSIEISATNTGDKIIPFGLGWHPYFRMTSQVNDSKLKLPKLKKIEIDERMIPTGKMLNFSEFQELQKIGNTNLDNCFLLDEDIPIINIELENESGRLVYWQNVEENGGVYLQIFTPPHRKSIALEPMTCNVDAFNNQLGLVSLRPQEKLSLKSGVNFHNIK